MGAKAGEDIRLIDAVGHDHYCRLGEERAWKREVSFD